MGMEIEVRFRPATLEEAKMADEILEMVVSEMAERGGVLRVHREHRVSMAEGFPWFDHGLEIVGVGALHAGGARVPLIEQVKLDA